MRTILAIAAIVGCLGWSGVEFWRSRPIHYGAGKLVAPADPIQRTLPEMALGVVRGYDLTELAEYEITARVLSSRRYRGERGSDLCPIDLALGWGRMSDEAVLDSLEIEQRFRFYFYGWRNQPPIPVEEIARHSANTHAIPADATVQKALFKLRRGSVAKMRGSLVRATGRDVSVWNSSLTRDDTGPGACELFLVQSIEDVTPKL